MFVLDALECRLSAGDCSELARTVKAVTVIFGFDLCAGLLWFKDDILWRVA